MSGQTSCFRRWRCADVNLAPVQVGTALCQRMHLRGCAAAAVFLVSRRIPAHSRSPDTVDEGNCSAV